MGFHSEKGVLAQDFVTLFSGIAMQSVHWKGAGSGDRVWGKQNKGLLFTVHSQYKE